MPTEPLEPKKPKPVRAHHYPNGMLMVFDADGEQVPEFQGEALTMLPALKAAHPDVEVLVTQWRTGAEVKDPNILGHDPLGPLYGPAVVGEHDPKCSSLTVAPGTESAAGADSRCDCGAELDAIEGPPCHHPECRHGTRRHEIKPDGSRGACQAFDGADEDGCPCQSFEPLPLESEHAEEQAETIARARE